MKNNIFIAGTGTDVGKTIASAILVQAYGMNYWKPVQAGDLDNSDSMKIANLVERKDFVIFPEAYRLTKPVAPHSAAKADSIEISLDKIHVPESDLATVIESAGGILVPLNEKESMADMAQKFQADVIIVSKNYLGSINHSLLTWEALMNRNIKVLGWIFTGEETPETQDFIKQKTGLPMLLKINNETMIDKNMIKEYANILRETSFSFAS